jgi:thiamine pyrophosphate-dependent acetolactate synthase large subunit-like protein
MNDAARDSSATQSVAAWGSDVMADMLRALEIPYIALNPGASFRACTTASSIISATRGRRSCFASTRRRRSRLAHGYARVTGRPLAVALHANVGLMHATMAIFNAWCDRIPMLLLGGVGPLDAMKRRPWVDWIHTSRDLGALVRGYSKWDDLPGSVPAALEAILRAYRIAMTLPQGPTYVALDAALQEERLAAPVPLPDLTRFRAAVAGAPPQELVREVARLLEGAARPLVMIGRASSDPADFARRVALAERIGAVVLTDIKTGATFPTTHPLHPFPPSLYVTGDAARLIVEADVILSLDWIDLGGTLRQACGGELPAQQRSSSARSISTSTMARPWTIKSVPPTDLSVLAAPDAMVAALVAALGPRAASPIRSWFVPSAAAAAQSAPAEPAVTDRMPLADLARVTMASLAAHRPSYIRLSLGWPGSTAASSIRSTTSASTAAAASARVPAWQSGRRWRCAVAIGCRSRCWATAIT